MNRTLISTIPYSIPLKIASFVDGSRIYDSSCSNEARVYYIDRDGGYYLKRSEAGSLSSEAEMTRYFYKSGLGAEVLDYITTDADWLLCRRASGEDCTFVKYIEDPKRLSALLGELLRSLHEKSFSNCPVLNRTETYKYTVEENYKTDNYDKSQFPDSFGYSSADQAYRVFTEGKDELRADVLIHGDYCLPNVILDNWRFSAFIDLGNGGVGDRHIDLFWGVWTLWFNLKTAQYTDRFLDAYGRDAINTKMLRVIAAAEVFG